MAAAAAQTGPVVKNLLIKDASGNTQLIEVIQTAPGKFMTASGHSIKTSTAAGGVKTIIRTSSNVQNATTTAIPIQPQPPQQQTVFLTTAGGSGGITPVSISPSGQIIRTSSPNVVSISPQAIIKGSPGRQVMAIPIQPAGGLTPIFKAANIKTEFGTPPQTNTFIQPRPVGTQSAAGSPYMQVIQAGNQRLLLTQTPNGPQLTPITTLTPGLGGQQIATLVSGDQMSPSGGTQTMAQTHLTPTLNLSKQSFISPILDHTGARKRVDFPSDVSYESKRRKAEKGGKGLRHFSMKVCEKVRTKGITTYNEVADELVNEFASPSMGLSTIEQQFDQKNIRRRVYDALNVLMAMNIISKEKKEIKWLGLPTNSMQECTTLEKDRQKRIERLKIKTQQLHDLIIQQVAFKQLVERNKQRERDSAPPPPHGSIHLPFLIVNTAKNTVIDCSISSDKMEYLFNFDGTFEIHDDIEVLKRMGLALGLDKGECTNEDILKAKSVLPKALEMYIDQIAKREEDWTAEFGDLDFEEGDTYYPQLEGVDSMDGILNGQGENVCFEISGHSSGLSMNNSTVDGLSLMNMSGDDDLNMQVAVEGLHNNQNQSETSDVVDQSHQQQHEEIEEEEEESFVEEEDDEGGMSE